MDAPSSDDVLKYEKYQYGPYRASWLEGFLEESLPENVTRYITNGAGVSIPNENMGYYFSGMRGKNWGIIETDDSSANVTADSLISVNMTVMRDEIWSNQTLPQNIPGRANAELVWIPVSESGVLVAIGGVVDPEVIYPAGLNDSQISQSESISPGFMTSLPIYDIAGQQWYLQNTSGTAPGQLTQFCSVVAPANDSSSFNVYIYGGYNGYDADDVPSDDVYILSIPSFHWIKAYSGSGTHGRRGHKCALVYPNQMLVIGGQYMDPTTCVEGGIIQVFNLNTLEFQDTYDPTVWSDYKVPNIVTKVIGGNINGSATTDAPSTWGDSSLSTLFGEKYTKTITTWYPYSTVNSSASASPTVTIVHNSGGLPKWVAPVLGVILGLIFVTTLVVLILIWRRRRHRHRQSDTSVTTPSGRRSRILSWIHGTSQHPPKDDTTVTSTDIGDETAGTPAVEVLDPIPEAGGGQIHELQGISSNTYLTYLYMLISSLLKALSPPIELPTMYNTSTSNVHQFNHRERAREVVSPVSRDSSEISIAQSPFFTARRGSSPHPPQGRHDSTVSAGSVLSSIDDETVSRDSSEIGPSSPPLPAGMSSRRPTHKRHKSSVSSNALSPLDEGQPPSPISSPSPEPSPQLQSQEPSRRPSNRRHQSSSAFILSPLDDTPEGYQDDVPRPGR
ncbi:MAG: hypothetical protein M1834_003524 [Cirrosporium novae-zelandiae]|nr:MAG: hypothetical protein M1834_003524 [Cirrosporium novae-zelandiae]